MIIIAPGCAKLKNGNRNPKDYPFWSELVSMINEPIIQVGVEGEKQYVEDFRKNFSLNELKELIKECRIWIGVDSMFQHLAWSVGKKGIVLWGIGNPNIFGHKENINLSLGKYRKNQFDFYDNEVYNEDIFMKPKDIIKYL